MGDCLAEALKESNAYLGFAFGVQVRGHYTNSGSCLRTLMLSHRVLKTVSDTIYVFLVVVTFVATGLSCAAIISQAVRTSPTRSWFKNFNALIVGASYLVVVRLIYFLFFC